MSLAAYLAEQSDVWDRIVAKYGLRPLSLRELVGHGDQHADFAFAYGAPAGRPPTITVLSFAWSSTASARPMPLVAPGMKMVLPEMFMP
jgi:hypothetical protein